MTSGDSIVFAVAARYDFDVADLMMLNTGEKSVGHCGWVANECRYVACYALNTIVRWSLVRIAKRFNYKDHTSALYAIRRGKEFVDASEDLQRFYESLEAASHLNLRKRLESVNVLDF